MARDVNITIPYEPRELQMAIHNALYNDGNRIRYATLAIHRRFGKSVFAIMECVYAALKCPHKKPRIFFIAPTFKQAKSIAWEYLKEFTNCIPGMKYLETELVAKFPGNGARIQLLGAENFESIRGNYCDLFVCDEFGNMNPQIWREVLRPAISDRLGSAIFLGTPNGKNHFYDIYCEGVKDDEWYAATYGVDETKLIPQKELDAARKTMGEEEYRQEFLCDWASGVRGNYYSLETGRVREEGRLCTVPHAPTLPVDIAVDLGMDDATAIWFVQCVGSEIRCIDYGEWKNTSLQQIVLELSRMNYIFGTAILPHDAMVREMTTGRTRIEMLEETKLFQEVACVPRQAVTDGVNAARTLLAQTYFDKNKCEAGFDSLENYRKQQDPRTGEYKPTPVHDKYSHGADAYRYLSLFYDPYMGQVRERAIEAVYATQPQDRFGQSRVVRTGQSAPGGW